MSQGRTVKRSNPQSLLQQKFRRRRKILLKKANELSFVCGADVYVLIHHRARYYTYKSTEHPGWPPSEEEVGRYYRIPERTTRADFEQRVALRQPLEMAPILSSPSDNPPPTHTLIGNEIVEGRKKEWEVDQILDSRRFRGKLRYLVAWKGYPPSWQPSTNLTNCADLLRTFHDSKKAEIRTLQKTEQQAAQRTPSVAGRGSL